MRTAVSYLLVWICAAVPLRAQNGSAWKKRLEDGASFWSFQMVARPDVPGDPAQAPLADVEARRPDAATGLEAWFRAESIDGRNDDPVRLWKDESGQGRDLRPTADGYGSSIGTPPRVVRRGSYRAVRFGEGNGLATPATLAPPITGDAAYTLSVVARLEPLAANRSHGNVLGIGEPASGANPGRPTAALIELQRGANAISHAGGFGHNANGPYGSYRSTFDRVVIITLVKQPGPMAASSKIYVNGTDLGPLSGTSTTPDLLHRADWSIFLGNAYHQIGSIRGDISEVLIYSTALDNETRRGVEAGLVRKHGIRNGGNVAHPIDAFIRARLAKEGLSHGEPADRRTLIRRAFFDLLGMPPSPERVEAFVADKSPDAWEKLIDELLESTHYGERWGRHWLDVARYADTGGYETDIYFRNAWRYRDWVVKSFNDDKPYDLFVQHQIAGHQLWPNDLALEGSYRIDPEKTRHFDARVGTGLYALGPQIHESNMDASKLRLEQLTDWVDTTGSAFLGLTLGCARCHDHKFDPISQRDYYALQAVFASAREVDVPIAHGMGIADYKQHYPRVVAVDEARRAYRAFERRTAGRSRTPDEEKERRRLLEAIGNAVLALPTKDAQGVPFDGILELATVTVLGPVREPLIAPVHVLSRGDLSSPTEPAEPAVPALLASKTGSERVLPATHYRRRADLALWITRPDHPLTWRVMANRVWAWHFAQGLVTTPSDFGVMGTRPSHPKLLDWLASEFIARGASVKALHRLIMTSETYRQTSRHWSERHERVDPQNRLLWRMNRRRLEGEAIWDAIHTVAGTISLRTGGRPVMPPLAAEELTNKSNWVPSADPADHTRRGLYMIVRRNFRFPLFGIFDAPVSAVSCAGREVSTVAPQALWLLNNRLAFGQAKSFAARVRKEAGDSKKARVDRAFRWALGRPSSDTETKEALELLTALEIDSDANAALEKMCLTLLNLSEFLYVD